MPRKVKYMVACTIGIVLFLALIALLDLIGSNKAKADSGSSTGFYGDVTYTCECPNLPANCWVQNDVVEVCDYPDGNRTGITKTITWDGPRFGHYGNLSPGEPGYWYLQGRGGICGSTLYLVYWAGQNVSIQQNVDMHYNTEFMGPQP
jgi:hypothetical protein